MAYCLTFFCRSGQGRGSAALARYLPELTGTGDRVLVGPPAAEYADEVGVCEVATDSGSGMPAAGWVVLQFSAGVRRNAERVISADPDAAYGIWGSDLLAELTLSGDTDWPLVNRIWAVLVSLWSAVAWDEISGFGINDDALGLPDQQPGQPARRPGCQARTLAPVQEPDFTKKKTGRCPPVY
jgi:hypothetical protein